VSLDLHPEELLYQQSLRDLTADEQADLAAHLARCAACAMQVGLRPALQRASSPSEADYALAARVMERLLRADPASWTSAARLSSRTSGLPWVVGRVAAVLVILLGTGVAGSAIVARLRSRKPAVVESLRPRAPAVPSHLRRVARGSSTGALDALDDTAESTLLPAPPAPDHVGPEAVPSVVVPASEARVPVSGLPLALKGGRRPAPPAPLALPDRSAASSAPEASEASSPAPVAAAPVAPPSEDAASLFTKAERAQRQRLTGEAERLFGELAAKFPGSREEIATRPLFGQLLLDELGRPGQALQLFDHYLRDQPTGTLAEEAEVGRAQALERLGRPHDAQAAWQDLLRRHPDSIHAELARRRLAAAGAARP
jgi:tetratricopeptide (TPR) repeat protein